MSAAEIACRIGGQAVCVITCDTKMWPRLCIVRMWVSTAHLHSLLPSSKRCTTSSASWRIFQSMYKGHEQIDMLGILYVSAQISRGTFPLTNAVTCLWPEQSNVKSINTNFPWTSHNLPCESFPELLRTVQPRPARKARSLWCHANCLKPGEPFSP